MILFRFLQMKKKSWRRSAVDSVRRSWPQLWVQVSDIYPNSIVLLAYSTKCLWCCLFQTGGAGKSTLLNILSGYRWVLMMDFHYNFRLGCVSSVQCFEQNWKKKKSNCRREMSIYGAINHSQRIQLSSVFWHEKKMLLLYLKREKKTLLRT